MQIQRYVVMTVVALALAAAAQLTEPVQAQGTRPAATGISIPIVGSGPGATFNGVLNITRFTRQGDQILGVGTLVGTLTNTLTNVTSTVIRQIAIPIDIGHSTATCQILNLVLGPLDLDLLGLQIHLNQVVLNIQAEPGPGNLLGNLLCAVANLLNGGGPLQGLVNLLNDILAALG